MVRWYESIHQVKIQGSRLTRPTSQISNLKSDPYAIDIFHHGYQMPPRHFIRPSLFTTFAFEPTCTRTFDDMANPRLFKLRDEILVSIFKKLNKDLLMARSICTRFYGPASSCFQTITTCVPNGGHWRPTKADAPMSLAQHVRTVHITCDR